MQMMTDGLTDEMTGLDRVRPNVLIKGVNRKLMPILPRGTPFVAY